MKAAPNLPLEAETVDLRDLEKGESATVVSNGHELIVVPEGDLRKIDAIAAELNAAEFDWATDNNTTVVFYEQPRTAVYFNPHDQLVIRQMAAWDEDQDSFVFIAPSNIADFIDKLTDICGIPSAGKP